MCYLDARQQKDPLADPCHAVGGSILSQSKSAPYCTEYMVHQAHFLAAEIRSARGVYIARGNLAGGKKMDRSNFRDVKQAAKRSLISIRGSSGQGRFGQRKGVYQGKAILFIRWSRFRGSV